MQIERATRKSRSVPLTPLIDVVFLLLVFFMLSSTFIRTESLELMLPQTSEAEAAIAADEGRLLQVFVSRDGSIYLGRKPVNKEQLVEKLSATFKIFPDVGVLLLSGPRVSVQQMVTVMDHIYMAGSTNLSVASWEPEKVQVQPETPDTPRGQFKPMRNSNAGQGTESGVNDGN